MALVPGARLGVYEVVGRVGAGGMGEVYRGRDAKLNRDVALKTLLDLFVADPERLARFKREAQLLALLNHSNIAGIYGFEESNSVQALVLEWVDGPTLADRIAQGPVALDDAMPIAMQIAAALEAAHEQGIVHRDLKPANIKVRPDGTVKVLDFGLAKALAGDAVAPDVLLSPTITSPAATRMGVILGTAAYMSPEQARGKVVDKGTDIWAFGCVLYEMLTGKRAFEGEEVSDSLASILKSDPDWDALPADIPPRIRRVLRRCLEKDRKLRYHDIADVQLDLAERGTLDASVPPVARSKRVNLERIVWLLIVSTLAGLLVLAGRRTVPAPRETRFHVDPPPRTVFGSPLALGSAVAATSGAVSPDGTRLVFPATDRDGKTQLWLQPLDSFAAQPLPGTDGGSFPFWSPDGRFIGFSVGGRLKRVDRGGGSAQTICETSGSHRGATWGNRGVIVFSSGNIGRLYQVPANGGPVTPIEVGREGGGEGGQFWPNFLPDGRHFLYWVRSASDDVSGVYVRSIESGTPSRRLVASDTNAAYAPGVLLFTREGTLLRQGFDADRLTVTDQATPLVEPIARNLEYGVAAFSVSANGVLTFRSGSDASTQFAWFDRAGRLLETVGPPGNYRTPALSPDDKRLVYMDVDGRDIWMLDMARRIPSKFTSTPAMEGSPVWSPDGTKIFYRSSQDGGGVFEKDANGVAPEQLSFKERVQGPTQISPDGKLILYFVAPAGQSAQDIYVVPTTGEKKSKAIVQSPAHEVEPQFSPDGRWLAYSSTETGRGEIYVQPYPPTGERWKISTEGGRQPLWRRDGKELYFVNEERKFYAVDVIPGTKFDFDTPRFLFQMRANVFNTRNSYVPSRDGQRFLVNMILDPTEPPLSVIQNWAAIGQTSQR